MAKSIPEGSAFIFSRKATGPGLAVVARRVPRGRIVALYLFDYVPLGAESGEYDLPDPSESYFKGKFSDEAIREGTWTALGIHRDFRRDVWPFDSVGWAPYPGDRGWLKIRLDDRNPLLEIESTDISEREYFSLPPRGLYPSCWDMGRFVGSSNKDAYSWALDRSTSETIDSREKLQ